MSHLNDIPAEMQHPNAHQPVRFDYYPDQWQGYPLGVILRSYREAYGQSLYHVGEALKIRAIYLQYLEDGHYGDLPGIPYAVGFVRAYAGYLGLPVEEMVERFRAEADDDPGFSQKQATPPPPALKTQQRLPITAVLGTIGGAALILYVLWFTFSSLNSGSTESPSLRAQVMQFLFGAQDHGEGELADFGTRDGDGLAGDPTGNSSAPVIVVSDRGGNNSLAPNADTRAPITGVGAAQVRILRTEDRQPLAPGMAPVPQLKPNSALLQTDTNRIPLNNPNSPTSVPSQTVPSTPTAIDRKRVDTKLPPSFAPIFIDATDPSLSAREKLQALTPRIQLTAKQGTWVQVQDQSGSVIDKGVLLKGDVFSVPNQAGLVLITGNLKLLEMRVDGRLINNPPVEIGSTNRVILNPDFLLAKG